MRIIYLLSYKDSPFYQVPVWDAKEYHVIAIALSHGEAPQFIAYRAPLYPIILSLIMMIFGKNPIFLLLAQICIGSFSCFLIYRISTKLYGNNIGLICGLSGAVSGLMIYFDLELLPTSMVVFIVLLFFDGILKIDVKRKSVLIKVGLMLGCGVLLRPTLIAFLPIAIWWVARKSEKLKRVLQFSGALAIPMIMSFVLHLSTGAGPILVSAQGGINFFIGNHRQADGITANLPGHGAGWNWDVISRNAEIQTGKKLKESEVDRFYWNAGLKEILADIPGFVKRCTKKAALFWNHVEISSNRDLYYHGSRFPLLGKLLWIGFPLFLPFAVFGAISLWKDDRIKFLTLSILLYFLLSILFFVNARFRHPILPLLIILSGAGFTGIFSFRNILISKKIILILSVLVAILISFGVNSGIKKNRWDYGLFTEGKILAELGRVKEADLLYSKALAHNPAAPYVNFHRAEIALESNLTQEAVKLYNKELNNQPQFAQAWNNLGIAYQAISLEDSALYCFQQAHRRQPQMLEASSNAARIYARKGINAGEEGDFNAMRKFAIHAQEYAPEEPLYKVLELEAKINLGDTTNVLQELERLIKNNNNFPPANDLKMYLESIRGK